MTKLHIILVVAAMFAGTPALAQEAAEFAGPRAEVTIGFDQLRFDLAQVEAGGRGKQDGLGYGFALGYDAAIRPTVIAGIEAGLNLSDIRYATGNATDGNELRKRRELTLAGRLGTPITPNALLYGKVGYANLQVRESQTVAGATTSQKDELDGVLFGAGVEVKMSPQAYWKSEFRYYDYASDVTSKSITTGIGVRF